MEDQYTKVANKNQFKSLTEFLIKLYRYEKQWPVREKVDDEDEIEETEEERLHYEKISKDFIPREGEQLTINGIDYYLHFYTNSDGNKETYWYDPKNNVIGFYKGDPVKVNTWNGQYLNPPKSLKNFMSNNYGK